MENYVRIVELLDTKSSNIIEFSTSILIEETKVKR